MRIAVDITPALRKDPTGVAYHITELVTQLLRQGTQHDWIGGVRFDKWSELHYSQAWGWTNIRYARLLPPFFQILTGPLDLFHSTGSLRILGPQGSVLRVPRGIPRKLLTLHDLIPMEGWFVPNTDRWVAKRTKLIRESIGRVDGILTVSEFVRRRVLDTFGFPPERVRTVWNGLNHARFRLQDPGLVAAALARHGIDGPYVISFAGMYPRKNIPALVRGFALSRASKDGRLLLGGFPRGDVYERVAVELAKFGIESRVRFLGYVDHGDVPLLYAGARVAAFPSLYEGFGFPVIEPMACGTPVATSNRASMPEIGGDAAAYFDPETDESIAQSLDTLWLDEHRRAELRARGLERVKQFSWERAARETLAFYDDVMGWPGFRAR